MSEEVTHETRPASEAMRELVALTADVMAQRWTDLGHLALRDAGLDPADGWRFDVASCTYRRRVPNPPPIADAPEGIPHA